MTDDFRATINGEPVKSMYWWNQPSANASECVMPPPERSGWLTMRRMTDEEVREWLKGADDDR